jgi:hypothetical protein
MSLQNCKDGKASLGERIGLAIQVAHVFWMLGVSDARRRTTGAVLLGKLDGKVYLQEVAMRNTNDTKGGQGQSCKLGNSGARQPK